MSPGPESVKVMTCDNEDHHDPPRADSGESGGGGHLRVPLQRTRGISLPNGMEESLTKNNSYLLRQYNIKASSLSIMNRL